MKIAGLFILFPLCAYIIAITGGAELGTTPSGLIMFGGFVVGTMMSMILHDK